MKHLLKSDYRKKRVSRLFALILICSAAVLLSGCSGSSLEEPYSFADRSGNMGVSEGSASLAPLFASALCVVDGETKDAGTELTAEAGALFNITDGTVLYSKNVFEELYPASITKVMTAILAIEEGELSDEVTVTQDAVITEAGASLAGIKPGDTLTMEQLLYGLMIPSGNDAANAIAVHMSGSLESFAERMNEKARELGATHTHFKNPNGLTDPEHYTTAYDLYLIFNECIKHDDFVKIIMEKSHTAKITGNDGTVRSITWEPTNFYATGDAKKPDNVTVIGGKTGTTQLAGNCLILLTKDKNDHPYISIVMKADTKPLLYKDMTAIVEAIPENN